MSKHIPGPWQKSAWVSDWSQPYREDSKTSTVRAVVDANGEAVAIAVVCYDGWTDKEKDAVLEANARLIAAAPNLLEVVIQLLRVFPTDSDLIETGWSFTDVEVAMKAHDAARATITKATGDQA